MKKLLQLTDYLSLIKIVYNDNCKIKKKLFKNSLKGHNAQYIQRPLEKKWQFLPISKNDDCLDKKVQIFALRTTVS